MGLIKEPPEIDFFVDPKPLTKEEEKKIREYIKVDKEKRLKAAYKKIKSKPVKDRDHIS